MQLDLAVNPIFPVFVILRNKNHSFWDTVIFVCKGIVHNILEMD